MELGSCLDCRFGEKAFCARFPEPTRKKICEYSRPFKLPAGKDFFIGDLVNEIVFIYSGVSFAGMDKAGLYHIVRPGHVANIVHLLPDKRVGFSKSWNAEHWGFAASDVHGCAVPIAVCNLLVESDPGFAQMMLTKTLEQYSRALETMVFMSSHSSEEKMRWFRDAIEPLGVKIGDLTHERIGKLLGINRVTVTRLLAKLD